ncbi:hypothetical protein C0Q70_10772 [Pomacea canaliculata]|uniref:F-box domain-containing protein n=1 Tax=Pomacea canaliculata TaxID=400727 RepID=A0A2T7P449_POMCA|nr:hypothetical protein C0Q70_10772 [Pomacea canaliculata]
MAVKAFPAWNRILHSSLGFKHFENDREYAQSVQALVSNNYLLEEITCIAQYGQFFTHAVIWLEVFPSADNPEETDLALLGALATHCFRLKSLVIYHPPKLSPSSIMRSGARYIKPLQRMFSFNPSLDLSLCRVSFLSEGTQAGLCKLLDWYQEHNVLQKVACLDFSHGKMESTLRPMNSLVYCTSLRVLKCPIQYLNTQILQQLVEFNLQELCLISDVHTGHLFYDEQSAIDWHGLQLIPGRNLMAGFHTGLNQILVHYVFRYDDVVLCPNPYARSLALDSLCDGISRDVLISIADTYGATLEMFSIIEDVWYPSDDLVNFSDLEDLPTTFQYLASRLTFVECVVPGQTLDSQFCETLSLSECSESKFEPDTF